MLPDFPGLKKRLEKRSVSKAYSATHQGSVMRLMTKSMLYEGHRWRSEYPDGTVKESELDKAEVILSITDDEYAKLTHEEIQEKLNSTMSELHGKMLTGMFDKISKVIEEKGQVVSMEGKGPTPEKYLEMLEKVEINFNEDKSPRFPTLVAGPGIAPAMQRVMEECRTNPIYRSRFDRIISDQYEQWRLRESARKLVG